MEFHFAKEDVYLVTANPEVAEAMRYSGCKDVGLGVMFSNGEKLVNDADKLAEWQQVRNIGENIAQKKWEEQRRRDEQRKALLEQTVSKQDVSLAEDVVARPIEKEAETGSLRGPAAVSVSAAVQVQTPESNSANLKKLLLEKKRPVERGSRNSGAENRD